ncbi:MAG TPA: F0F1 ATP synthase subunit delta [Patescibacteria group bacterium]|nr:F0F1 ATP synthase subunit delta [Patescibacteria group bacterium]
MKQSALSDITSFLKTKKQSALLQEVLEETVEKEYTTQANPMEFLKKRLPVSLEEPLIELFSKQKENSPKALYEFLKTILSQIKTLPIVSLTLAIEPTHHMIDAISQAINQPSLIDIDVNPSLIGGAIVAYQGKYSDKSLKKTLENV